MENLKKYLSKLRGVNTNTLFQSVYVFLIAIISATFWSLSTIFAFPSFIGLAIVGFITLVAMFLFNDFKYIIPGVIMFIFTNSEGFENNGIPYGLLITAISMFVGIGVFFIINRKNLSLKGKSKSFYALIYLAIFSFFPLLWNNAITNETSSLYFVYFNYLLYLIVYLVCLLAFKGDTFFMVSKTMQYLCAIIATECIVKVLMMKNADPSINVLSCWYYLGWGLCNEAGIMLCMGLPFIFVDAFKFRKPYEFIILYIKLLLVGFGMLLTTSRGTYLFGMLEAVVLSIYFIYYHKKRIHAALTICAVILAFLLTLQCTVGIDKIMADIDKYVFTNGLSSNGRTNLWQRAYELWKHDGATIFFGNGMVCELSTVATHYGSQLSYWVYHSTFFEALACYGIVGVAAIGLHFFEKYRLLFTKFVKPTVVLMAIGFAIVDLYGMIDNTYGMYYYMIPLVIIMASMDTYPTLKIQKN